MWVKNKGANDLGETYRERIVDSESYADESGLTVVQKEFACCD